MISGCERDDICAETTTTTPMLIIKFIDFESGVETNPPSELEVQGTMVDEILEVDSDPDSILVPLRTDVPITEYLLTINSDVDEDNTDDDTPNSDLLSIQYTPQDRYLSSACGFITNFLGITVTVPESMDEEDTRWIQNFSIEQDNVTDESSAHLYIFH